MKKYILKRTVHNHETFPIGTIVVEHKSNFDNFKVVEGKMKGQTGCVADGMRGFLCDDTPENRRIIRVSLLNEKRLLKDLNSNAKIVEKIPSSKVNF